MSKKLRKVEESATSYSAKRPAKQPLIANSPGSVQRTVDKPTFKKVTDKLFSERRELLHKLAQ